MTGETHVLLRIGTSGSTDGSDKSVINTFLFGKHDL